MQTKQNQTRGDLLVLVAALIWGVAFYFQKTTMLHIGPMLFLGLRSLVAVAVLLPWVFYERKYSVDKQGSVVPISLLGGLIFFCAGSVQQFGIVSATVINTGVLTALYIVFTPLAYWLVKRKAPSLQIWLSVGLAFTGVWLLGKRLGTISR